MPGPTNPAGVVGVSCSSATDQTTPTAARRAAVPLLIQGGDSSLFSSNLAPPGGMKNSTGLCWIPAGLRSVGVRFCRRSDDVPG